MPTHQISLVLLPGIDGTDVFFAPLLAALPPWIACRVVTYPPRGGNSYADLLPRVEASARDAGDFFVLGWSFSGPLALMLAAAEPQRVRSVILSASFVRPPHPDLARLRFALIGPAIWLWRAARRLPLWLLRPRSDPFRQAKSQTWRRIGARALAKRVREVMRVDAREALRACRQPVLYIAASRDGIVPRRCLDEILGVRPSVKVVTIEGEHFAMYANPKPAAEAIVAFIAEK
jgi:pimeloyl-ACP methyl ester carboxylesterase